MLARAIKTQRHAPMRPMRMAPQVTLPLTGPRYFSAVRRALMAPWVAVMQEAWSTATSSDAARIAGPI